MNNKKLLTTLLALLLTATTATPFLFSAAPVIVQAEETATETTPQYEEAFSYMDILQAQYDDIVEHAENCNVTIDEDLTFDYYVESYYAQNAMLASEFLSYILENISYLSTTNTPILESETLLAENIPMTLSSAGEDWENIDDPNCSYIPNYDYLFLGVRPGDLVDEPGFEPFGHTAIIETWTPENQYCTVIESSMSTGGVCRSYIDNNRIIAQKSVIMRVNSASDATAKEAVDFCEAQLGDGYTVQGEKIPDADSWMCSTLIWAAYNSVGIDICPNSNYTWPDIISSSPLITAVPVLGYKHLTFEILQSHYSFPAYWSWSVKIINPNPFRAIGEYNDRLCFELDAKTFNNTTLLNEQPLSISANGNQNVYITHNGTAGFITAYYKLTFGNNEYKVITYANNLKYEYSVGSCTQYYAIEKIN